MRGLLVLYDSACPFCARCRAWLEAREQLVPLVFLCCRSAEAHQRYGRIEGLGRDLVVVDEHGRYWAGAAAFVICFWALEAFRWIGSACASELVWPFARALFGWVSDQRGMLSSAVGVSCTGEHCGLPPAAAPYR
jgi:predicted DCC family thiol-disulfide oxidoreductase YuxK